MSQFTTGLEALAALNETNEGNGASKEFTRLKSGGKLIVKVISKEAVQRAYVYGIYKQINSFIAKEPSTKSAKGYPVDNLTPWDKAWKHHKDQSEIYTDAHGVEASKYSAKQRFVFALWDCTQGEIIYVDFSKNQAQGLAATIAKFEKKLGKLAFELTKEGSGTSTKVSLTPILDMDEDLTDKERENFAKAPNEISTKVFDGIWFEQDEAQMVELLKQAGFDVSLIGYDASASRTGADTPDEEELPF